MKVLRGHSFSVARLIKTVLAKKPKLTDSELIEDDPVEPAPYRKHNRDLLEQDDMTNITEATWIDEGVKRLKELTFTSRDFGFASSGFIASALKRQIKTYHKIHTGDCKQSAAEINDIISKLGGTQLIQSVDSRGQDSWKAVWIWEDGMFSLTHYDAWDDITDQQVQNRCEMECVSSNKDLYDQLTAFIDASITNELPKGEVYVLQATTAGVKLASAGYAAEPLSRDNYDDAVLAQYDHLVADLTDKHPCGRLNLIYGEPGTGKTYLVKSLLETDVMFVIVPPSMITQLCDPSVITALINKRERHGKPIVFVLEDADSILVERMSDNMSSISALLNTTDGILGATLDLRVVATTNAKKVDIDKALLRPGRLCTRMHIESLPVDKAEKVYKKLTNPDAVLPKKATYSLAEVYKLAYDENHNLSRTETVKEKKDLGFKS